VNDVVEDESGCETIFVNSESIGGPSVVSGRWTFDSVKLLNLTEVAGVATGVVGGRIGEEHQSMAGICNSFVFDCP
jgi:hypothetical protein